jgi:hypothetical protein
MNPVDAKGPIRERIQRVTSSPDWLLRFNPTTMDGIAHKCRHSMGISVSMSRRRGDSAVLTADPWANRLYATASSTRRRNSHISRGVRT